MATFVLVHGSMHGSWCWQRVTPLLRAAGHEVRTPTLSGLGERVHLAHPDIDLETHITDVLAALGPTDAAPVILVGHSYATMVVTGIADRVPERIAHLIYLDGPIPADGDALIDFFPPEGRVARYAHVEDHGEGWRLLPPEDLSGLGLVDERDVAWVRPLLTPQPFKTMTSPLQRHSVLAFTGTVTVISCTDAPPASWRDAVIAQAHREGWCHRDLASGHDAMITAPELLAQYLIELAS